MGLPAASGQRTPRLTATRCSRWPPAPPADVPAAFSPETALASAVGVAAADCLAHAVLSAVIAADPVADIPTYRGLLPGAFKQRR
jgi:L-aminopeptidase/D-esterase-like protein